MGGSCVAANEAILQMLQKRYQLEIKIFWKKYTNEQVTYIKLQSWTNLWMNF